MNILTKIKKAPQRIIEVLKNHPVEILLFLYIFVIAVLDNEGIISKPSYLILAPIFITIAYALNNLTAKRIIYYLCWIPIIPLSFLNIWGQWLNTSQCVITLSVLCPLIVLMCRKAIDNKHFVNEGLSYIYSAIISGFMSGVIWGLSMAIYFSVLYIFNGGDSVYEDKVFLYSALICYLLICPLFFFRFIGSSFESKLRTDNVFDILLNYIATPALLIYTLILYVYFIKIIAIWELPEGGIAYLVFGFTIFAIAVKALQPMLSKRIYDKFFNNFSLISIPAIIMFWIGVCRRINEYGLTEWRVYLVVCGTIMTITLAMFATKKLGRYFYVTALSFVLLGAMAYIPRFSADEISIGSQEKIVRKISSQLRIINDQGRITLALPDSTDSVEYEKLYSSLKYLSKHDTLLLRSFGVTEEDIAQIPRGNYPDRYIYVSDRENGTIIENVSQYKNAYIPSEFSTTGVHSKFSEGILNVFNKEQLILSITAREIIGTKPLTKESLLYKNDSIQLRLSSINAERVKDSIEVTDINVELLMIK